MHVETYDNNADWLSYFDSEKKNVQVKLKKKQGAGKYNDVQLWTRLNRWQST